MTVHALGWRPVVQYPVAGPRAPGPVTLDAAGRRLGALAHPVRLRLVRTLARGPHTTGEPALAWDLTPHYAADLPALTALGTDLLAAVLR